MLSTDELQELRNAAVGALIDTCTVKRPTLASDGYGGHTMTTAVVYSGPCALVKPSLRAVMAGGNVERSTADAVILFPHNADVHAGDLVEHASGAFRIQAVLRPTYGLFLTAEVVRG